MSDIIETLEEESTNLALHTKLCAQRYNQLLSKFETVNSRLDNIELILVDIKKSLSSEEATKLKTYLSWAGVVIVALLGAVGHQLTK